MTEYLVSPRLDELEADRVADQGGTFDMFDKSDSEPPDVEDVEDVEHTPSPDVEHVEHVEGGRGFAAWDGPEADLTQNSENGDATNHVPGDDEFREKGLV